MINQFADATDDHQFIHVDPERAAKETPFRGTIAHGFLTLSLLSTLAYEALPMLEGATMGINYGFDKLRFVSPPEDWLRACAPASAGGCRHPPIGTRGQSLTM